MTGKNPSRPKNALSTAVRRTPIAAAVGLAIAAGALPAYAAIIEPGAALGDQFQVNTKTIGPQDGSALAMDAAGDFVVAWQSLDGDGDEYGILAQRYQADGTPAGSEFQVNTTTLGDQGAPAVAMDAAGDFVVIWQSTDGSAPGIFAQRYDADGTPAGSEVLVNTTTLNAQVSPAVAMDAVGDIIVAWESHGQDGDGAGVFAQRYSADGAPAGSEIQVNTTTLGDQEGPAVAMDAAGHFVVTWESSDGAGSGIFSQRYHADGTPNGTEFQVNTFASGDQDSPTVAMDAAGDFVVAWESYGEDGDDTGIVARLYQADGTPAGSPFPVNTFTSDSQDFPGAAMDAMGDFVVVWEGDGSGGAGAYGRQFTADGTAVGADFPVRGDTDAEPFPTVAMDAAGEATVAWTDDDDSDYGIFARRYARLSSLDLASTLALAPDDAVDRGAGVTLTASIDNLETAPASTGYAAIDAALSAATTATGLTARLTLPDDTAFGKATGANWTCPAAPTDHVLSCDYTASLPLATRSEMLTVTVTAPDDTGAKLTFDSLAFGDQPDAKLDNNTASAAVTVQNSAPVAADGKLTVNENGAGIGSLKATDPDKDAVTYSIVTQPNHGNVFAESSGDYVYVPADGYSGADSFTFKASDGIDDSNTARTDITVKAVVGGTAGPPVDTSSGGGGGFGWLGLGLLGLAGLRRRGKT